MHCQSSYTSSTNVSDIRATSLCSLLDIYVEMCQNFIFSAFNFARHIYHNFL